MSDNEKNALAGELVLAYQAQLQDLALQRERADRVKLAYATFARHADRWLVLPGECGRVHLKHPSSAERELGKYLLSQTELASLVTELAEAESAAAGTKERLARLGITFV